MGETTRLIAGHILPCRVSKAALLITFVVTLLCFVLLNFIGPYNSVELSLRNLAPPFQTSPYDQNEIGNNCEVIHVGFVCAGLKSNMLFNTLLKSIYFYRVNPLHFHIFVDEAAERSLKVLFETWRVPDVTVTFYSVRDHVSSVSWVKNQHYSGNSGMLKLMFPILVPLEITKKLIVLDSDLLFLSDIVELWRIIDRFNSTQAVGIIENQSDFYLNKVVRWPALGRGFNTGVVLYDTEKIQKLNWYEMWSNTTKKVSAKIRSTQLGDQDVMNSVFVDNPSILYEAPCFWNVQLSILNLSFKCYEKYKVKLVHWNSGAKVNAPIKNGDYFRDVHTMISELDGNLFRRTLRHCSKTKNSFQKGPDNCTEFRSAQPSNWRTLPNFRDYKYERVDSDVTFVAHLTYDQISTVQDLASFWEGPMSLAFYGSDEELANCNRFIFKSELLKSRKNIGFHAVFREGEDYPSNVLRNISLSQVYTDYVFLADIHLIPMRNLYQSIRKAFKALIQDMTRKAVIIPAFQIARDHSPLNYTKPQLLELWEKKLVHPLNSSEFAATDFTNWKNVSDIYNVNWEKGFAPHIVVSKNVLYDNRFMNFDWDRVSLGMELEAQGYEWIVLPEVFTLTKEDGYVYNYNKRSSVFYKECISILKREFIEHLAQKYEKDFEI